MTNIASLFTFDYDRETQLVPALALTLFPVISFSMLGVQVGNAVGTTIGGVSLAAIVIVLVASLIRNVGKAFARRYFKGYPTTVTCLRLQENAGYTAEHRRGKLEAVTGVQLLTKQQEVAKPVEADERLSHAVNTARDMMRDQKRFPLLWRELKAYGYWRNMYALRWWGVGLSLIGALAPVVATFVAPHEHILLHILAALVGITGVAFWLIGITKKRFEAASDQYTDQFFKGLFQL